MKTALIIFLSVTAGVIILLTILKAIFGRIRKKLLTAIREKFPEEVIVRRDLGANFFGLKSGGPGQVRGNGVLVLTSEELYFMLAVPRREFLIPLTAVTSISLPRSFLGKSIFRPLLCVEFHGDKGIDTIAWAVRDPEDWKSAIEAGKAKL